MFNATLERAKSAMAAFKNFERLSEKTEVVALLLKDYEEQSTEWLWQTDKHDRIVSAPPQILAFLGVADQDLREITPFPMLVARCTEECGDDAERLRAALKAQTEFHDIQLSIKNPQNGALHWIVVKGRPQFDRSGFIGFRGIFADATVAITAERRVKYLAAYDPLTNLRNRNAVHSLLSELQNTGQCMAAFAIDLDDFKSVNDNYGT